MVEMHSNRDIVFDVYLRGTDDQLIPISQPTNKQRKPRQLEQCRRIPKELQDIFLASNRGEEVHLPPKNRIASKVFVYQPPPNLVVQESARSNSCNNNKSKYNSNSNRKTKPTDTLSPSSRKKMVNAAGSQKQMFGSTKNSTHNQTNSSRHSRGLFQRTIGRWSTRNMNSSSTNRTTRKMKDKIAADPNDDNEKANDPNRNKNQLSDNLTKLLVDTNLLTNNNDDSRNDPNSKTTSFDKVEQPSGTNKWKSRWNTVLSSIAFANNNNKKTKRNKKQQQQQLTHRQRNSTTTTMNDSSNHLNFGQDTNHYGNDDDEMDDDGNRFDGRIASVRRNNSGSQHPEQHQLIKRNSDKLFNVLTEDTTPPDMQGNNNWMIENNLKKNVLVENDDGCSTEEDNNKDDELNLSPDLIHKRLLRGCGSSPGTEHRNHRLVQLQQHDNTTKKTLKPKPTGDIFIPSEAVVVVKDSTSTTTEISTTAHPGQDVHLEDDDLDVLSDRDGTTLSTTPSLFENKTMMGTSIVSKTNHTLQLYFDTLLSSRGYCTNKYSSIHTGYHNDATPLQEASYSSYIVNVVTNHDCVTFERLLRCGLSTNPSNYYGESIMHIVCKLGYPKLLQIMIDVGASVQISDDIGRTPLHSACWGYTNRTNNTTTTTTSANIDSEPTPASSSVSSSTSYFETIELLLQQDIYLMNVFDSRGSTPLSYIRTENWPEWITFFQTRKDRYWPEKKTEPSNNNNGPFPTTAGGAMVEPPTTTLPSVIYLQPDTKPTCDPLNALDIPLARIVASGQMEPEDAALIQNDCDDDDDDDENSDDDDEDNEDAKEGGELDDRVCNNVVEIVVAAAHTNADDDNTSYGYHDKNATLQTNIKQCMEVVYSAMKTSTDVENGTTNRLLHCKDSIQGCTSSQNTSVLDGISTADDNNHMNKIDDYDDDVMEEAIRQIRIKKQQQQQENQHQLQPFDILPECHNFL